MGLDVWLRKTEVTDLCHASVLGHYCHGYRQAIAGLDCVFCDDLESKLPGLFTFARNM